MPPRMFFPGGELESTPPFSGRYKVNLRGCMSFVRLALASAVSIVPFVTIGSHAQLIQAMMDHVAAQRRSLFS